MAILIALLFTGYFTRAVVNSALYMAAFAFLGLVAIVNWIWWVHYPDPKFFLSSIYYLYNFCIVITVITFMARFGDLFRLLDAHGLARFPAG